MSDMNDAQVGDKVVDLVYGAGEVIGINKGPLYPISVRFCNHEVRTFTADGRRDSHLKRTLYYDGTTLEVHEAPRPKRKVKRVLSGWWMNIYPDYGWAYPSLDKANSGVGSHCIDCIPLPDLEYEGEE